MRRELAGTVQTGETTSHDDNMLHLFVQLLGLTSIKQAAGQRAKR
jgi:hypothetical protein